MIREETWETGISLPFVAGRRRILGATRTYRRFELRQVLPSLGEQPIPNARLGPQVTRARRLRLELSSAGRECVSCRASSSGTAENRLAGPPSRPVRGPGVCLSLPPGAQDGQPGAKVAWGGWGAGEGS